MRHARPSRPARASILTLLAFWPAVLAAQPSAEELLV